MSKTQHDAEVRKLSTLNCLAFAEEASLLFGDDPLSSPVACTDDPYQLLEVLFPGGSQVCTTSDLYRSHTLTLPVRDLPATQSQRGVYFKVNRVLCAPSGPRGGYRDRDCARELMMLEMDKADVAAQLAFWTAAISAGLPVTSLVTSGGKSLHAIVRLNAASDESYKAHAAALLHLIAPMVPDATSINPSRYTRLPGCRRGNAAEGDGRQRLIYLNPSAGVWTPEHPVNVTLEALCCDLAPPPEALTERINRAVSRTFERPEPDAAAERKFKSWRKHFPTTDLDIPGLLDALGWTTAEPVQTETEVKHYIGCPWMEEHTGGGEADGPKDAYLYVRDTNATFKWGFHCSHDSCQAAKRHITQVFDLIREQHADAFEAHRVPFPDKSAPMDGFECDEEPPEAEQVIEGSGLLLREPVSEWANARIFLEFHRKSVRYLHDEERWVLWNKGTWKNDTTEEVRERAKKVTDFRILHAEDPAVKQEALRFGTAKATDGLLKFVRSTPPVASSSEVFDTDPWLIAVTNGVLNLQTGDLSPAKPEDMLRSQAGVAYRPEATCPRWLKHLQEVHPKYPEISRFLQVWMGYTLTGMTSEEKIVIFYGSGKNGKSTIVDTFHEIMGSYAGVAAKSLLLANPKGDDPRAANPAFTDLRGKRMVSLSETDVSATVTEASIKEVTKGEPITARELYGNNITFRSKAKIIFSSNHRPRILGTDEGIWRRLVLVNFGENFTGREDPSLKEIVASEAEGIFAWAVRGCQIWQDEGLIIPHVIEKDTAAYRKEEDVIGMFLDEVTTLTGEGRTCRKALYERYTQWVHESGMKALSRPNFNRKLVDKGFSSIKVNGYEHWVGIELLTCNLENL